MGEVYSLQASIGYWVTRLSRALETDFEQRLAPYNIMRSSWAVLSAILHHNKISPVALSDFIGIDRAAITRHLDRLEKQKLIKRTRSTTDRRTINLELTSLGANLVPKLAAQSMATNDKFTRGLSESEKETIQAIIQKMLANADEVFGDL